MQRLILKGSYLTWILVYMLIKKIKKKGEARIYFHKLKTNVFQHGNECGIISSTLLDLLYP